MNEIKINSDARDKDNVVLALVNSGYSVTANFIQPTAQWKYDDSYWLIKYQD